MAAIRAASLDFLRAATLAWIMPFLAAFVPHGLGFRQECPGGLRILAVAGSQEFLGHIADSLAR